VTNFTQGIGRPPNARRTTGPILYAQRATIWLPRSAPIPATGRCSAACIPGGCDDYARDFREGDKFLAAHAPSCWWASRKS